MSIAEESAVALWNIGAMCTCQQEIPFGIRLQKCINYVQNCFQQLTSVKQLRGDHITESKLRTDVQFNMNLL